MSPYRAPAIDDYDLAERAEIERFTRAARVLRVRSLAFGLLVPVSLAACLGSYAWWFWFGNHCGFGCM